jgi:hypothetical protein
MSCDQRGFRDIYATVDEGKASHPTVRVYQAYNEQIAHAAAAANSFAAPRDAGMWSESRMTWIKPSAAWMAYRCGWTLFKDKDQACVLALDVDRSKFEVLLMEAVVMDDVAADQKGTFKEKPVVVQWDPEREVDVTLPAGDASGKKTGTEPFLKKLESVRSLQIGLRGRASALLLDQTFVRNITDVTAQFQAAHAALVAGDAAAAKAALCPDERLLDVPKELREALHMDFGVRQEATHDAAERNATEAALPSDDDDDDDDGEALPSDDDDDDGDWSLDTSTDAVKARQAEWNSRLDNADAMLNHMAPPADQPLPNSLDMLGSATSHAELLRGALQQHCVSSIPSSVMTVEAFARTMSAATSMAAGLVFLDVDGVLNNMSSRNHLDPCNLTCLARLLHITNARIVLSTSWRHHHDHKIMLHDAMHAAGIPDNCIVGQTPELRRGTPDASRPMRSHEIRAWIDEARASTWAGWDGTFVVLDDLDLLGEFEDPVHGSPPREGTPPSGTPPRLQDSWLAEHFIWVDPSHGLGDVHVAKATAVLRRGAAYLRRGR